MTKVNICSFGGKRLANRLVAVGTVAFALTACFETPKFLGKGKASFDNGEFKGVTTKIDDNGVVSAKISSKSDETLMISASQDSKTGKVGLAIPPGALSLDIDVAIEPAGTMASQSTMDDLGLRGNYVENAAQAILIQPSQAIETNVPMVLAIPAPAGLTSLALADGTVSAEERVAVVFRKISLTSETGFMQGVIPRDELEIKDGQVFFESQQFGMFQAVIMATKIEQVVEVPVDKPMVSVREQAALPTPSWQPITFNLTKLTRTLAVSTAVTGVDSVSGCMAVADEDKLAPWDHFAATGSALTNTFTITKNPAHKLYLRFECTDNYQRLLTSDWQEAAITVGDDVPPAPFAITAPLGTVYSAAVSAAWQAATDAQTYRLIIAKDASCSVPVVTLNNLKTTSVATPQQLADGVYYVCAAAFDQFLNRRDASNNGSSFRVHTARPDTQFTSAPNSFTTNTNPSFGVSCTGAVTCTYEYRLDAGAWTPSISSTFSVAASEGSHTVDVRAVDQYGARDATPASKTFTVDVTLPTSPSLSPVDGTVFHDPLTVTASSSTDTNWLHYRYTLGSAPSSCADGMSSTGTIIISETSDTTLYVVGCDKAGNMSSATSATYTYAPTAAALVLTVIAGDETMMDITGGVSPGPSIVVEVSNTGPGASADLSGTLALDGDPNFNIVNDSCTASLPVSGTCTVTIEPVATNNTSYAGTITVNAENAPVLALTGSSTGFSVSLDLTPGTATAMDISGGASPGAPVTFTVTNSGSVSSGPLSAPVLDGNNPTNFQISSDTCAGSSLAPGGSCSFDVEPVASADGSYDATVAIGDGTNTSNTGTLSGSASGFTAACAKRYWRVRLGGLTTAFEIQELDMFAAAGTLSHVAATNIASSTQAGTVDAAFDSNSTTSWKSTNEFEPWIGMDFGSTPGDHRCVDEVILKAGLGSQGHVYVESADVLGTWTTEFDGDIFGDEGVTVINRGGNADCVTARFWRLRATNVPTSNWAIRELGFLDTSGTPAIGTPLTNGNDAGYAPGYAFDDNATTLWRSTVGNGAYAGLDLGTPTCIKTLKINLGDATSIGDVVLEYSEQSSSGPWLTAAEGDIDKDSVEMRHNIVDTGVDDCTPRRYWRARFIGGPLYYQVNEAIFDADEDAIGETAYAALASSTFSGSAMSAFDANYGTYWQSNSETDPWFALDLGSTPTDFRCINDVALNVAPGSEGSVYIESSDDATNWIYEFEGTITSANTDEHFARHGDQGGGSCISAQYWRIRSENGAAAKWGIREFALYEMGVPVPGSPFEDSTFSTNASSYAMDGDPGTFWQSTLGDGAFIGMNLGTPHCIEKVLINLADTGSYGNVVLEYSNTSDTGPWQTIGLGPINTDNTDEFRPVGGGTCDPMQYWRISLIGPSMSLSVNELALFAMEDPGTSLSGFAPIVPGTASGLPGDAFDYAVGTAWQSSNMTDPWITLDLGASPTDWRCIGKVQLYVGAVSTGHYRVESSPDNATWKNEFEGDVTTDSTYVDIVRGGGGGGGGCIAGQFWRLRLDSAAGVTNWAIREFALYEPGMVMATGSAFADSVFSGYSIADGADNDDTTLWKSTVGVGAYIGLDLGSSRCIEQMKVNLGDSASYGDVMLEYSNSSPSGPWQSINIGPINTDNYDEFRPVATMGCTPHQFWRARFVGGPVSIIMNELALFSAESPGTVVTPYGYTDSGAIGGAAADAFDGSAGTSWQSVNGTDPWIGVDLGASPADARCIVEARFNVGAASTGHYVIESSDDASTWQNEFEGDVGLTNTDVSLTRGAPPGPACTAERYWRLQYADGTANIGINEISFGDVNGPVAFPFVTSIGSATALGSYSDSFDTLTNTLWQSVSEAYPYIGIDFGSNPADWRCVTKVTVNADAGSLGNYDIQSSSDGTIWNLEYSGVISASDSYEELIRP